MSNIWLKIISLNGSQNNAFEELVCQLANEEEIKQKKDFIRVGAPDGGVEAYCILKNGDEFGWQAKYFFSLGDSQWNQLEESFKTALEKHPRLVKYYICLPIDLQDPRVTKQKWSKDKWDLHVKKWREFATQNNRKIEIVFWGSFELFSKLSLEKHSGRKLFWFNEIDLSDTWFTYKLQESIDALGSRYTPELNFELEVAKSFDGIAYNAQFINRFMFKYDEMLQQLNNNINSINRTKNINDAYEKMINVRNKIENIINSINFKQLSSINLQIINEWCSKCYDTIEDAINCIQEKIKNSDKDIHKDHTKQINESYKYKVDSLRRLAHFVSEFQSFIDNPIVHLANNPVLILRGQAGIGKSHLLADIALRFTKKKEYSILLLGQQFVTDETPWRQILKNMLRLDCNEIDFLGALNAKAQLQGSRIIIIIDAINEGRGIYFWKENLISFIKSIRQYKYLGVVLSLRSSYEKLLISDNLYSNEYAHSITHHGFADVEYEASKLFFKNYNIEQPSIPLLHPEFQNPLFLKLFCEGLYKAGFIKIPEGYEGITSIIGFYLSSINKKISMPKNLDYPEEINLVERVSKLFVKTKLENNSDSIEYETAFLLFESEFAKYSKGARFLDKLISEGVFTKNILWNSKDNYKEVIFFAYQRFDDHLTTSYLLEQNLDMENPKKTFEIGKPLSYYLKDITTCNLNKGIIDSLSIQLPEKVGSELYELAPYCSSYYPVIDSFVESLIWRKASTISRKILPYIRTRVGLYQQIYEKYLNTILLVNSNPNHYFNAEYLHKRLMSLSLAQRDAGWSIFIHKSYERKNSVFRLIEWAFSDDDKCYVQDESILLISECISWFLASSNRYLRDKATKSLVCLLENRINILIKLLKKFKDINDPYIYERLFAVAYGCTCRTRDAGKLKELCNYIYKAIFNKDDVYPHILLRDYAREVIEYAVHLGLELKIDLNKVRPPYGSEFPKEFPSNAEIDQKYKIDYNSKDFKDHFWSQNDILRSMTTEYGRGTCMYGDFGRYTFESALKNWPEVNPSLLSNWAVERVFQLGYDTEIHGEFDREQGHGRENHNCERIGKKYQWIAFYEILARTADNFKLRDGSYWSGSKYMSYDGPWEPYVRDFDPTSILYETKEERFESKTKSWWFSNFPDNWNLPNIEWVKTLESLPDPGKFLKVQDENGIDWFQLVLYPEWNEPKKVGAERYRSPFKQLLYDFRSFLIKSKDLEKLKAIIGKDPHISGDFPTYRNRYEIFSREYYWSPAYKYFSKPYFEGNYFRKVLLSNNTSIKIIIPAEYLLWEEEYDHSKESTISYYVPTAFLFDKMNMKYAQKDGHFINNREELICYDPAIHNDSLHCLLIRGNEFIDFLRRNDLSVFWIFYGEKRINEETSREDYKGHLELKGFYYLNGGGEIEGNFRSKYSK